MLKEHQNEEQTPCPMVEIHFAVLPTEMHQDQIKCTAQESKHANDLKTELKKKYLLSENMIVREKMVIPSSIEPSVKGLISTEDDFYAHMLLELEVPKAQHKHGVLSVLG